MPLNLVDFLSTFCNRCIDVLLNSESKISSLGTKDILMLYSYEFLFLRSVAFIIVLYKVIFSASVLMPLPHYL